MNVAWTTATNKVCCVDWCVCVRVEGSNYCAVHRINPDLRPQELEPDEELADGSVQDDCEDCNGSGKCDCCDGDGEASYECQKCNDWHQGTCHTCDGDGVCQTCHGAKNTGVRKKES
jgi:hypothetical protein